ncbi:MAG: 2-phosphosulfolactate phosphatase [Verrucomicrobia bacterium]|nr:2-phosphosulfolactate phosphatase [Verrucomicrobiota bacterium]
MDRIEAVFSPSELPTVRSRDLRETVCVVFDVLRATSTMLEALANGADSIRPVGEIAEALAERTRDPEVLLAGERHGLRISAALTGGVEFDLGNSPREFTAERVAGRRIVMTTTNGTRAIAACAGAATVLAASFGNLAATARWIERAEPRCVLLVGAGTQDHAALEDVLGVGALADRLWTIASQGWMDDAIRVARELYVARSRDLLRAVAEGRNGHRLIQIPELADDVPLCLQIGRHDLIARLHPDGCLRAESVPA